MTREQLLQRLTDLRQATDIEYAHGEADMALLIYINDSEITYAFSQIKGWYA